MWRAGIVPLAVFWVLAVACTPETAARAGAAPTTTETPPAAALDPAEEASRRISAAFGNSGESARVEVVAFEAGLLRVSLDLPIQTLGDADVYMRVCNALAPMVGDTSLQEPVLGVQTFAPGPKAVVATGSAELRCSRFYE
jgi:hypothetical protein